MQSRELFDFTEEEVLIRINDDIDTSESHDDVGWFPKLMSLWAICMVVAGIIWAATLVFVVGGKFGVALGSVLGLSVAVLFFFISMEEPFCCSGENAEEECQQSQVEDEWHRFNSLEGNDRVGPNGEATLTIVQ